MEKISKLYFQLDDKMRVTGVKTRMRNRTRRRRKTTRRKRTKKRIGRKGSARR